MKRNPNKPLPSQAYLQELFEYDNEQGHLIYKQKKGRRKRGDIAGCSKTRYRHVSIDSQEYLEHRIIWMYVTGIDPGPLEIDHINEIKTDNRFENLRIATPKEQAGYRIGHRGYVRVKRNGVVYNSWSASIRIKGKQTYIGCYPCPLLARLAYEDAFFNEHGFKPRYSI